MNVSELEESNRYNRKCNTTIQKLCYGLGHVYNDLCAAMWFSYTLFYLQIVLQIESRTAGILIMLGQIVDSLATPLAGWAVDRTEARRAWHLAGTLAVSTGFSLIFCLKPATINTWVIIYYGFVISLFQIGWAITQISHLSIIPEIATSHSHTSDLTAIRYTASVCCNISVYIITLLILRNNQELSTISSDDYYKFKEIALIITLIGLFATLFFYCGSLTRIEQPNDYQVIPNESDSTNGLATKENGTHFLKSSITYQVSLMYMASRLFTTLNLIYIPLYLDERYANNTAQSSSNSIRETIASIPLASFIASFLTSILLKYRTRCCNDKVTYSLGSLVGFVGSLWISFNSLSESNNQLYIIAVLIGISGSTTMVTSLCLTAEFVKVNGFGGGSVYSTVTFIDKLASGGIVLIVQNLQCVPKDMCPNYYQHVLSYVCGGVTIIGLVSLATLQCQFRHRQNRRRSNTS